MEEIKKIMSSTIQLLNLKDIECHEDIPETSDTIEGNALQKARHVYEKYGYNCFSDDTGLEIEALDNRPGVYSARYAGPAKDANANMQKVLEEMAGISNRNALFKTVIALIIDGKETLFTGVVNGKITLKKSGSSGFGYDPIFQPNGYSTTFSEMSLDEKNKISHRGKAVSQLLAHLTTESVTQR